MKSVQLLALALTLLLAGPAHAMRCGTRIVTEGDYAVDVLHRCGEPEYIEESADYRYRSISTRHGRLYGSSPAPVAIEVWTYNFGPNRLMRRLRFENGELQSIRTLGYGYHRPRY